MKAWQRDKEAYKGDTRRMGRQRKRGMKRDEELYKKDRAAHRDVEAETKAPSGASLRSCCSDDVNVTGVAKVVKVLPRSLRCNSCYYCC